jgi:hypothetical protein
VASGCSHVISEESEAAELEVRAGLSDPQLSKRDLDHRNSHTGVQWLNLKLLWVDHLKRFPSLLHFVLNSTSSTLVIGLKAGANKAQIEAMNAVFAKHHCYYRFKTAKWARDAKATGNECKKMLWTRGVMLELVDARWGPAVSTAESADEREVAAAQGSGEHLLDDEPAPPPPPPPLLPHPLPSLATL